MKKLFFTAVVLAFIVGFATVSSAQYPWEKESNKAPAAKASAPTSAGTAAPAAPKPKPTGRNVYQKRRAEAAAAAAAKGKAYGQPRATEQTMNKMVEKGYPR